MTHVCVGNLTIIVSDHGLSPGRRQAIIWIDAGILLIGPLWTNWNINRNSYIFIQENPFENVVCKMASILSRFNELSGLPRYYLPIGLNTVRPRPNTQGVLTSFYTFRPLDRRLCVRKRCLEFHSIGIKHYHDVMMGMIASQITSLNIVYSTVYSDADQRKHQSSASLAYVRWIHRGPVNSPHKWPVTRKMFPLDDVIMNYPRVNE